MNQANETWHSGHAESRAECPLSRVKRTCRLHCEMSANDPKRTFKGPLNWVTADGQPTTGGFNSEFETVSNADIRWSNYSGCIAGKQSKLRAQQMLLAEGAAVFPSKGLL